MKLTKKRIKKVKSSLKYISIIVKYISIIVLLITLLICVYGYIAHAIIFINFPYEIDSTEGWFLDKAIRASLGQSIYPDCIDYPLTATPHPPVYLVLVGILMNVFGRTMAVGRAVTFVSSLLIVVVLYKLMSLKTKNKLIKLLPGLLFLTSTYLYTFGAFFRVDALGILLSLLGIYLFLKKPKSMLNFYTSILFFVLAIYTKQSEIAAPVACFFYLLANKKFKKGFYFLSLTIGLAGIIFLIINVITNWQFYLQIIVWQLGIRQEFRVFNTYWARFLTIYWIPLLLAVIYAISSIRKVRLNYFTFYFITIFFVLNIMIGNILSNYNHFLEFSVAIFILASLLFNKLYNKQLLCACILLLILFYISNLNLLSINFSTGTISLTSPPPAYEAKKYIDDLISQTSGDIIQDFEASYLYRNNKTMFYEPCSIARFEDIGLWSFEDSPLKRDLESSRFSLIIEAQKWIPLHIWEVITRNYEFVHQVGSYELFLPNNRYVKDRNEISYLKQILFYKKLETDGFLNYSEEFTSDYWRLNSFTLDGVINQNNKKIYVKCKDNPVFYKLKFFSPYLINDANLSVNVNNYLQGTSEICLANNTNQVCEITQQGERNLSLFFPGATNELVVSWSYSSNSKSVDVCTYLSDLNVNISLNKDVVLYENAQKFNDALYLFYNYIKSSDEVELKTLTDLLGINQKGILKSIDDSNMGLRRALSNLYLCENFSICSEIDKIKEEVLELIGLKFYVITNFGSENEKELWKDEFNLTIYNIVLSRIDELRGEQFNKTIDLFFSVNSSFG